MRALFSCLLLCLGHSLSSVVVILDKSSDAAIPTVTLILGANLFKGLKGTTGTPMWTIMGIIAVQYIFLPLLGTLVVKRAIHLGLVQSDPLYQFMILLQYATPPAMNIDGLARAKASGAADANNASFICCDCICNWISYGFCPNDDPHICWWCGSHHIGDCP